MRAILIDPFDLSVKEVDPPNLSYETMQPIIGAQYLDRSFLGGKVCAYIDDSGLTRKGQRFWHFSGSPVLMAGKALVVSLDEWSEPTALAPFATLAMTQGLVAFLGDAQGAERAIKAGLVERPCTVITTLGDEPKSETVWTWDARQAEGDEKNVL